MRLISIKKPVYEQQKNPVKVSEYEKRYWRRVDSKYIQLKIEL